MNKYDKQIDRDAAFLREKLSSADKNITVPDALSENSIRAQVATRRVKRSKRAIAARITATVLAVCVVISGFTIYSAYDYRPPVALNDDGSVKYASSYSDVTKIIKKYASSESIRNALRFSYSMKAESSDTAINEAAEDSTAAPGASGDYASTNTQVKGVDEADIVKTDGEYLYILSGSNINIVRAYPAEEMKLVCTIDISKSVEGFAPNELYIYNGLLITSGTAWSVSYSEDEDEGDRYTRSTRLCTLIYSLENITSPELVRTLFIDGAFVSSRISGGRLITVSRYTDFLYSYEAEHDDSLLVPATYSAEGTRETLPAGSIAMADTDKPDSYVTVSMLDLENIEQTPSSLAVLGGGEYIYCTEKTLYVSRSVYSYSSVLNIFGYTADTFGDCATVICSFDISGEAPVFKASGCVNGYILNNFSMDESGEYFRIATTTNDRKNAVYVLNSALEITGEVTDLAPGESIYAVRFMGSTAYVVTFYQTDPLFVIDLSDPAAPRVTGELKIPGFSSYLHPAGEGLLIGIGSGGDENGLDGSAKISLFDVSDPQHPVELDSVIFKDGYLNTTYKAFVSVSDGSFLCPVNMYYYTESDEDGVYGYYARQRSGAVRFAVENNRLVTLGIYTDEADENGNFNVGRCPYIGSNVYLVDISGRVSAVDMETKQIVGSVSYEYAYSGGMEYGWCVY